MNRRVPYKGFVIDARAQELRDGLGWTYTFTIEKHDGQGVTDTPFFLREPVMESSAERAIAQGKKRIDDGF